LLFPVAKHRCVLEVLGIDGALLAIGPRRVREEDVPDFWL
jgi:hypothetical protein